MTWAPYVWITSYTSLLSCLEGYDVLWLMSLLSVISCSDFIWDIHHKTYHIFSTFMNTILNEKPRCRGPNSPLPFTPQLPSPTFHWWLVRLSWSSTTAPLTSAARHLAPLPRLSSIVPATTWQPPDLLVRSPVSSTVSTTAWRDVTGGRTHVRPPTLWAGLWSAPWLSIFSVSSRFRKRLNGATPDVIWKRSLN